MIVAARIDTGVIGRAPLGIAAGAKGKALIPKDGV
jgi:hypothetical protein